MFVCSKKKYKSMVGFILKCYHRGNITPYIHIFVQHLHEMIHIHGDIGLFTMEGRYLFSSVF